MEMVRSGDQAQPAFTQLPARACLGWNREETAQAAQAIEQGARRLSLKRAQRCQFSIRQQGMSQQQVQRVLLAGGQIQSQQGDQLLSLQQIYRNLMHCAIW